MAKDIMMWVNKKRFPTIVDYIDYWVDMDGIWLDTNMLDVKNGKSRCFLLHRDGGVCPRVFGWFVIGKPLMLFPYPFPKLSKHQKPFGGFRYVDGTALMRTLAAQIKKGPSN